MTVVPSAAAWLFSRPRSGLGGRGGGFFICLMSDSSTAPAEGRWHDKEENTRDTSDTFHISLSTEVTVLKMKCRSCILYFQELKCAARCPRLSWASAGRAPASGTEAERGQFFSCRVSPCIWICRTEKSESEIWLQCQRLSSSKIKTNKFLTLEKLGCKPDTPCCYNNPV